MTIDDATLRITAPDSGKETRNSTAHWLCTNRVLFACPWPWDKEGMSNKTRRYIEHGLAQKNLSFPHHVAQAQYGITK